MDADARDGGRATADNSDGPAAATAATGTAGLVPPSLASPSEAAALSAAEAWQPPPSPPSSSAMTAPTDALALYYDADGGAIVGGDMVSLADAELSVHSMGSAIGGMDMSMELSEQQIRAFLARSEHEVNSALAAQRAQEAAQAAVSGESGVITLQTSTAAAADAGSAVRVDSEAPKAPGSSGHAGTTGAVVSNAPRPVVYYASRDDKIRQVREHPLVASVAPDGRTVECKCGRNVRLNPPWYILKFEQHIVSRNCTYLREKRPKRRGSVKAATSGTSAADAAAGGANTKTTAVSQGSCSSQEQSEQRELATSGSATSAGLEHVTENAKHQETGDTGAFVGAVDSFNAEMHSSGAGAGQDGFFGADRYALTSLQFIFARDFAGVVDGGALDLPAEQPQPQPPSQALSPASKSTQYNAMTRLQDNPHFNRVTPDGRIIECKCSQLVVLSAPWKLNRFIDHAKHKQVPRKRVATGGAGSGARSKKKLGAGGTDAGGNRRNSTVLAKSISRGMAVEAALRIRRKSFPRDIRWDAARAVGILPCPGLRDEKMGLFVSTSVQLTGGGRPRHKIAQELFPHLFPPGERNKYAYQLMDAEKLMLHDVIEGEAVWFVDKDGNSVRSLDCKGIIEAKKAETVCSSCAALRSNATLRTTIASTAKKAKTPRNPVNRKFCSGRVFSLLESEFDMSEEYARILRDLSLVNIPDNSALNTWMDAAEMGIEGLFDSHPALIGLVESMVTLKDKERRGVGMQNMTYSDYLDDFMRSIAELSPESCEFFQSHLLGRKQKALLGRKRRQPSAQMTADEEGTDESQSDVHRDMADVASQVTPGLMYASSAALGQSEGFSHLLDSSSAGMMPNLSIGDIQDVDLAAFSNVTHNNDEDQGVTESRDADGSSHNDSSTHNGSKEVVPASEIANEPLRTDRDEEGGSGRQDGSDRDDEDSSDITRASSVTEEADRFLSDFGTSDTNAPPAATPVRPGIPLGHVPCTGLRDDKVQCYVSGAVQIIGGSRPKYVIARELFPDVFGADVQVKISEKLSEEQRLVLQDAVFSECMWRVDKVGNCVRSLRCLRVADSRNKGVCRACRDLKSIPNFRSVLSRSRVPKNLENIKYVPSVYTESDPFLRKLSKNASFRGLYQIVKKKAVAAADKKRVTFWLKCARMGIFGHFRTHPVFEGLVESMVEIKDKERRGVGKQNMQYSKPLDDFMTELSSISIEAFDLFARKFCGRTLRSQKVKRRKIQLFDASSMEDVVAMGAANAAADMTHVEDAGAAFEGHSVGAMGPHDAHHQLMQTDELLGASRPMTSSEMDENQRLMDRMLLDEVRLSVSQEMQLAAVMGAQDKHRDGGDAALDPRTYLDAHGVLTTEI